MKEKERFPGTQTSIPRDVLKTVEILTPPGSSFAKTSVAIEVAINLQKSKEEAKRRTVK
jgi:hypothetical protein